jgi:phage shock protein PspC (stress-responsive transcriptional regulator)
MAALLGLAFWKNSQSYPGKSWRWGLGKAVIDTGLVVLLVIYAPALLLMYVVIWLTSPFKNKITQVTTAFASILAITHLAGAVFESVAVLGVFAVDLLSGQVLARMDKRERNEPVKAALGMDERRYTSSPVNHAIMRS